MLLLVWLVFCSAWQFGSFDRRTDSSSTKIRILSLRSWAPMLWRRKKRQLLELQRLYTPTKPLAVRTAWALLPHGRFFAGYIRFWAEQRLGLLRCLQNRQKENDRFITENRCMGFSKAFEMLTNCHTSQAPHMHQWHWHCYRHWALEGQEAVESKSKNHRVIIPPKNQCMMFFFQEFRRNHNFRFSRSPVIQEPRLEESQTWTFLDSNMDLFPVSKNMEIGATGVTVEACAGYHRKNTKTGGLSILIRTALTAATCTIFERRNLPVAGTFENGNRLSICTMQNSQRTKKMQNKTPKEPLSKISHSCPHAGTSQAWSKP